MFQYVFAGNVAPTPHGHTSMLEQALVLRIQSMSVSQARASRSHLQQTGSCGPGQECYWEAAILNVSNFSGSPPTDHEGAFGAWRQEKGTELQILKVAEKNTQC